MALALRYWGSAQPAAVGSRLEGGQQAGREADLSTWPDALSLHSGGSRGPLTSREWRLPLGNPRTASKDRRPLAFPWRAERRLQPPL